MAGADGQAADSGAADVWTVPNLLSLLRLAGVPVFVWLVLGPHADGLALLVLMAAGASDYLDGKLARAWGQTSALGALLDPLADRFYIVGTLVALAVRGIVPGWLVAALFVRDLVLLGCVPLLRRHLGVSALPVTYLGKAATLCLLYAFPLLLLSRWTGWVGVAARPGGWAFAWWGTALYWWAGLTYLGQVGRAVRRGRHPVRARQRAEGEVVR